jgi:hypothetical protein
LISRQKLVLHHLALVDRGQVHAVTKQWPDKTWNVPTENAYDSVRATLTISAAC